MTQDGARGGAGTTILVTGGAGFIGSAVVRLAIDRGFKVVNLDALTYAANLESLAAVESNPAYSFVKADIRKRDEVDAVFTAHSPDLVMHLAAESHVDRSIDGPGDFITTNLVGTFNMLEAARKHWSEGGRPARFRFHHVSTDEVFGSLDDNPDKRFTEQTPYDPRSPYSASKAGADHLVRAWHETFELPVVISNCSNNYGPYHFPEKLVPVVITRALDGKPITVYGDGSNIRDWLYVDDHADALLRVALKARPGESYNIGGNSELSNIELVRMICAALDAMRPCGKSRSHADLITFVEDRPGHDLRYAMDAGKIERDLGWRPSVGIKEGIERTVSWYLENERWWRPLLARDGVGKRLGRG